MGTLDKIFELIDEAEGVTTPIKPPPDETVAEPSETMLRAQEEEELDPALPPPTDPFSQLVDSMLRAEGVDVDTLVRKPYSPTAGDVTTHEWAMGREALFADEPYQFKCKRCFHYLEVSRDQTLTQALADKGVDPNCSRQIIQDITET